MQVENNEFGMQFVIPHTHYVFVSQKVPTFHHFLLPFISMHARIEKSQVAQTKIMIYWFRQKLHAFCDLLFLDVG